jgi:hypothetical protein
MLPTEAKELSLCSIVTTEVTRLGETHSTQSPNVSCNRERIRVTQVGQWRLPKRKEVVTTVDRDDMFVVFVIVGNSCCVAFVCERYRRFIYMRSVNKVDSNTATLTGKCAREFGIRKRREKNYI